MEKEFIADREYSGMDFSADPLTIAIYDNCKFMNCNFANSDLSEICFSDCDFDNCNMSLLKLNKSCFQNVEFTGCKLIGNPFHNAQNLLMKYIFSNSNLSMSSFAGLDLKKTYFNSCILSEVDFSSADLTESRFINCDLDGAVFNNSILKKVDFRSAVNYNINPEINSLSGARFSVSGLEGLVNHLNIEIE